MRDAGQRLVHRLTGTPIEKSDASPPSVFGDYTSIYDIECVMEDKANVPIYESRLAKLELKPEERPKIDPNFEEGASRTGIRRRRTRPQGKLKAK